MTEGKLQNTEQQLETSLQARHVAMIAIGGIIGAGLFVGSSTSIEQIGPAVVVSYGLAGLVILMIMRMLSEMAMMHPGAGSFTELIRMALGPLAGFVSGWLYWYFWVIVVAARGVDAEEANRQLAPLTRLGTVTVIAGLVGTLVFGIWLALSVGGYDLWDGWIIAALVLWVVGAGTGQQSGVAL